MASAAWCYAAPHSMQEPHTPIPLRELRNETARRACLAALCLVLAASSPVPAGESGPAPAAGFRASLQRAEKSPWPADAGLARVWLPIDEAQAASFSMTAGGGKPVACRILWLAAGEPILVQFDTSGHQDAYELLDGGTPAAPAETPWEPAAGLILEARTWTPPKDVQPEDAAHIWNDAGKRLGCSPVENIFHGLPPFGARGAYVVRYQGYLTIARDGRYGMATISDGPSNLFVDGRLVASKKAWSDPDDGRLGEHGGNVDLTAGRHRVEYYNLPRGEVFATEAAWRPPGAERFTVIPATAFAPSAWFNVARYVPAAGQPAVFEWDMLEHCREGELAVVTAEFRAPASGGQGDPQWQFDDGETARGRVVRHVFAAPGLRTVTLRFGAETPAAQASTRRVRVHPVWAQLEDWPQPVYAAQSAALMQRDPAKMSAGDLYAIVLAASLAHDAALLNRVGDACLLRQAEFSPAQAQLFYKLGFHYQRPDVRRYGAVEPAFRAAIARGAPDDPMVSRARLHLGGFLIHTREDAKGGTQLLEQLEAARLTADEARLRRIFTADALLVQGRIEPAREIYRSVGTVADPQDRAYIVLRRARLETAHDYLRREEWDEAERLARDIEWETPLERVNTETGLVMIQANIGRREYPFAIGRCRQLLVAAPTDSHRPEILYALAEAATRAGDAALAADALRRLAADHPYSEAAARAREAWPTGAKRP